jgi:hypothetical protein
MKASAAGLLKPAMSATSSRKGASARWAMVVAAIMFALTSNGMAQSLFSSVDHTGDPLAGRTCHAQHLAERDGLRAAMKNLARQEDLAFPNGLPDSSRWPSSLCALLQQVKANHDDMVNNWKTEEICNATPSDRPYFAHQIAAEEEVEAKTIHALSRCSH